MTVVASKVENDALKQKVDDQTCPRPRSSRINTALSAVVCLLAAVGFAVVTNRYDDSQDEAIVAMLRWLEANGIQIDGMEIVEDGFGGRDIRSTRPIREGEVLAGMPQGMMLGRDYCQNNSAVQAVYQLAPEMSSNEQLAICLLANMDGSSFWTPFINVLPKSIPLPIFWDEEDLLWLEVPHFIQHILETRESLQRTYESVQQISPKVTLQEYMHAWAIVASRAWGFNIEGEVQERLVPLFDLANHEPNGIMVSFNEDDISAQLVANRDYEFGAPIHTFYSNHSNFILLHGYGFTLENNDEHMTCSVDDGENIWQLNRNMGESSEFQQFMEKHRVASVTDHNNVLDHEILALEQLYLAIETAETGSTTIEEDETLLQDKSLSMNQRNAVRARRHEKLCWKSFKNLAQTLTEIMYDSKKWAWFEAKFEDWAGFEDYAQHIFSIL